MNFTLLITFLDGTSTEVTGIAADLVAFEAEYDLSVSPKPGHENHTPALAWVACAEAYR